MSTLAEVEIHNFKRISDVIVTLKGNLITISGQNAHGKSSFLDAIWATLGGSRNIPEDPLHGDSLKGEITIVLDDGTIATRRFWRGKEPGEIKSDIRLTRPDGGMPRNAQTVLNEMTSTLSFDPLAFSKQDNKDRLATLCKVYDIDVEGLNDIRRAKYTTRTEIGKDIKDVQGVINSLPVPTTDEDTEEWSIAKLLDQQAQERMNRDANLRHTQAVGKSTLRIQQLTEALAAEQKILEDLNAKQIEPDRLDDVNERLAAAEEHNERIRALAKRKAALDELDRLKRKQDELTEAIAKIDQQKTAQLAEMAATIPGLGIDETGKITYKGVEFDNASTAEKIIVSSQLAIAMQPEEGIRLMLIRAGNDLDSDMLERLRQIADESHCQILLERIVPDGEVSIVLENGTLKEKIEKGN